MGVIVALVEQVLPGNRIALVGKSRIQALHQQVQGCGFSLRDFLLALLRVLSARQSLVYLLAHIILHVPDGSDQTCTRDLLDGLALPVCAKGWSIDKSRKGGQFMVR
jgi:hypothetical protein